MKGILYTLPSRADCKECENGNSEPFCVTCGADTCFNMKHFDTEKKLGADFYFVTNHLGSLSERNFYEDAEEALKAYEVSNAYEPFYLVAGIKENDGRYHLYDTNSKAYWKGKWRHMYIAYFAVRYHPTTLYPETVIEEDGVFTTPEAASKYAKMHNGAWKAYSFKALQEKMAESLATETAFNK